MNIEDFATFCKKKGFVFQSEEIYGGLSGSYDYGPLGVELKKNIKDLWWKHFVRDRDDVYGIDGSIISSSRIWKASGHVDTFHDLLVEDKKTHERFRADHIVEDALNINADGMSPEKLWQLIKDNGIKSPKGNDLTPPKEFNLMFKTNLGPTEESEAFMRPETAQHIFVAFKNVVDSTRVKLPFGVAQIGKAFRNEISPRNFLFRVREFEQMEIEFFIHPDEKKSPLLADKHLSLEFNFLSAESQGENKDHEKTKISSMLKKKMLDEWHAYWLAESYMWYLDMGIRSENLRVREHVKDELSHYSSSTFDIDYNFPFGWKEIHGNANRGQFDLEQHKKHSSSKLEIFDDSTKQRVLPRVIEPSFGVDRAFLAVLYDAYKDDKERGNIVLGFDEKVAPIQVAVFPLVNKLDEEALEVDILLKREFITKYDRGGSIGRRYARADEQGIPYCVTVDFDTREKKTVTIRDRDSTEQITVKMEQLSEVLSDLFKGGKFG